MKTYTKIYVKPIEKLTIKADGLDPIGVFVEEFEAGQAKVTIEIFGEAWSYYWGSMGEGNTLRDFFTDVPYLAAKFCRGSIYETDYTRISKRLGEETDVATLAYYSTQMAEIYGDDWMVNLPTKTTEEFEYLKRIVAAIIEGFHVTDQGEQG